MLEFLGLESDVAYLFFYFLLIAIFIAPPVGLMTARGNSGDKVKTPVSIIIGAVLSVIALFFAARHIFILFITFQWKWLLLPFLAALAVAAILFFIFLGIGKAIRKGKYKRSTVMKQAIAYCKANDIVAVQCHSEMIRFYKELKNVEYCSDEKESRYAAFDYQCDEYLDNDFRPEHWKAYDRFPTPGEDILFADMGYPPLEDLDIFAETLASCLGGCAVAKHESYVEFKGYYVSRKTGIGTRAHHFLYTQNDRFVYKKKALAKLKKETGYKDPKSAPKKKAPHESEITNKWE